MSQPQFAIERLATHHNRQPFDCGVSSLDSWLKTLAGQFERRDLTRVYVAVRVGSPDVVGYYAISSHSVGFEDLPTKQAKGLPASVNVPVVLLGRLAVDRSVQGQGIGSGLLIDALRRTEHLADILGIRAIEVDAVDVKAREFYLKHGFIPLRDSPQHLYLTTQAIRRLKLTP